MKETADRDSKGHFKPGNKSAVGHKGSLHARRLKLTTAFIEGISEEDITNILKAMIKKAAGGNVQAAALVLDRVLGKVQHIQVSSDGLEVTVKYAGGESKCQK